MPIYCFTTQNGETIERAFPMGAVPAKIQYHDMLAYRDRRAEGIVGFVKGSKTPVKQGYAKYPMEPCIASGVHASQAQELRDFHKRHGLDIEVTNDGDPIYKSAAQRRKALKSRGMYDRNSFD